MCQQCFHFTAQFGIVVASRSEEGFALAKRLLDGSVIEYAKQVLVGNRHQRYLHPLLPPSYSITFGTREVAIPNDGLPTRFANYDPKVMVRRIRLVVGMAR